MRLRRRLIPFGFAAFVLVAATLPLWSGWPDDDAANRWTLLLVVAVFGFKAVLFGWMRQRMLVDTRRLTVFGVALVDFFTALTALAVVLAYVFGVGYYYLNSADLAPCETIATFGDALACLAAIESSQAPDWLRTINRALLAAAGSLIIATGIATAWEMHRAGVGLAVHDEEWDGVSERRGPLPGRRATDMR